MLKLRLLALVLVLIPLAGLAAPQVQGNYRLGSVVSDTWPDGSGYTYTQVNGVKLTDAGGTSASELLTTGMFYNGSWPPVAQLRVYTMAGGSLALEGDYLWGRPSALTYLSGVEVVDIDGNGVVDTVLLGNSQGSPYGSHLGIYVWNGASLTKERLYNFTGPGYVLETRGMAVWTNVGIRQIVTVGYYSAPMSGKDYSQLGIWSWDGSSANPTKNTLYNWTIAGGPGIGSQGYGVATGDVDGDGVPEIVTVGSSRYNDTSTLSQMKIWGWIGAGLPLLKFTREWISSGFISVAHSVAIRDLDGDGVAEVVVSGQASDSPFTRAELTIWAVDSLGNLNQLAGTNWVTSNPQSTFEFARVAVGDADGDGHLDIVTAGYISVPSIGVDYGALRVWSWEGSVISLRKVLLYNYSSQLLAASVGDVDADGKQDVVVAGFQNSIVGRKGLVEVRDVAYVYSTLALSVSPSPALSGQSVTVSGTLTNATDGEPFQAAAVLLEYSKDSGVYQILATVTTDSQGRFASSFTPSGPGSYMVRATWNGDEDYMGSVASAGLSVNKVPSVIVLSASSFTAKPGQTITISGYLYPASSETLTVTYTSPSGTATSHTATSDGTGAFSDQYTVDSAGTWRVSASWAGDPTTAGSSSNSLQVETQPEPLGLTLSPIGLIVALAALGLAGFAIVRKPRRVTPPSPVQQVILSQPAKVENATHNEPSPPPEPPAKADSNPSAEQPKK